MSTPKQRMPERPLALEAEVSHTVSMAVVSDMHCCPPHDPPRKSFLVAGSRRTPIGQHLVQALLALIEQRSLTADVTLCPGDLAHQASEAGMVQAWDHLGEIQRKLNSTLLLPTVGNHDVDSRHSMGPDPFDLPKTVHPGFPRPDAADKDMFWTRGFYHAMIPKRAGFIVLNTVIGHLDVAGAQRGTFDARLIEDLRRFLGETYNADEIARIPLRVAIMHHHPIVHSSAHFGSPETLQFGDQLLSTLGDFGFRFVVHGHRHEPRITRYHSGPLEQLVFAAGAFSAQLDELASRTKNLFHHVKLSVGGGGGGLSGCLRTWEFTYGTGWHEANEHSARIPFESALVSPQPQVEIDDIVEACDRSDGGVMHSSDIARYCPKLLRLLPFEVAGIVHQLRVRGYKVVRDDQGQIVQLGKILKP